VEKSWRSIQSASQAADNSKPRDGLNSRLALAGAKRLLLSVAVIAPFLHAEVARAQSIEQGWAGIAPGDWTTEIAYPTAQQACESMQNSVVPAFGHMVYGLLSVTSRPGFS